MSSTDTQPISDDQARRLHERIDEVGRDVSSMAAEQAKMNAVVIESRKTQSVMLGKLERVTNVHDERLREVETWKAAIDARLPDKLIAAPDIEQHLRRQDERISAVQSEVGKRIDRLDSSVSSIKTTIARWAGGAVVVLFLAQHVVVPLVVKAFVAMFGGG